MSCKLPLLPSNDLAKAICYANEQKYDFTPKFCHCKAYKTFFPHSQRPVSPGLKKKTLFDNHHKIALLFCPLYATPKKKYFSINQ